MALMASNIDTCINACARACTGGGRRLSAAMTSARPFQSMTMSAFAGAASANASHPHHQNPATDVFPMAPTLVIFQRQQKVVERPVRHFAALGARRQVGETEVDSQQDACVHDILGGIGESI